MAAEFAIFAGFAKVLTSKSSSKFAWEGHFKSHQNVLLECPEFREFREATSVTSQFVLIQTVTTSFILIQTMTSSFVLIQTVTS